MGSLTDALRRHQRVGLDTSIFIYQLEDSPRYAELAEESLDAVERGNVAGATSVLTLMEVSIVPLRLGRSDAADAYQSLISSFPNLDVIGIDGDVARRAAALRAAYNLRPADALQVAACLHAGASAFLTNDRALRRVQELQVLLLDQFLSSC